MEAKWDCKSCRHENWVSYSPDELEGKIYACCNCGKVHGNFKIIKKEIKDKLDCIPYKGIGSTSTRGPVTDAQTGETFWGDPQGNKNLTREQFAVNFGWDPWTIWCKLPKNQNNPVCAGFANRCKKTTTDPIHPPPSDPELPR